MPITGHLLGSTLKMKRKVNIAEQSEKLDASSQKSKEKEYSTGL